MAEQVPSQWSRFVPAVVVAGLIAVLVGCGGEPEEEPERPAASAPPTSDRPSPVRRLPTTIEDLHGECRSPGGDGFGDAAEYSGGGPHPIAIFDIVGSGRYSGELPAAWVPGDVDEVVLLVCVSPSNGRTEIGACEYRTLAGLGRGATIPLYSQNFSFKIYDLRTLSRVDSVRVEAVEGECPHLDYLDPDDPPDRVYTEITRSELRDALKDVVTDTAS